ncbi:ferric reductase-like transmembrane domain-containing protein [Actinomadura barringtoniae]|uniref:Ferric reductase-like transmembrane domain-containing protein n=1 Tax=Actinomadura barringtoniae TaxID=1427535 RepID=A0A939PLT7_9ACTN|nr:ferric reductase-like transmembrane domain-containing protein [Actinomadura barringtoniae]MBO2450916.1 ferric reductase-like transmembrane domain-containing protein [Actinomadura barringtoniae]
MDNALRPSGSSSLFETETLGRPPGGSIGTTERVPWHQARPEPAQMAPGPAPAPSAHSQAHAQERPPGAKVAGNKLFVVLLFWGLLATSIALWAFGTPPSALKSTPDLVTAGGRVTGMIGGYLLLVQVLMMSRVAWLETWIGGHDLMRWHRQLGVYLLLSVLTHAVYITVGYSMVAGVDFVSQTVTLFNTVNGMVGAYTATGIMVAVSMLAIRGIRRRMPYEVWHWLHLSTYAVLFLAYSHQFTNGAELARGGFARWYWMSLYALVVACLFWGRVVEPLWLNLRHRFEVMDVVSESETMFSVYIGGRHLDRMDARAGQYFRWRFLAGNGWWQSHPFSLSASPNPQWLRLTVNAVGSHTREMRELRPGTRVLAAGPSGTFTARHRTRQRALLIAGGSGIAPIRALLDELPSGSVVIYRASDANDIVFGDELRGMAQRHGFDLRYVLGSRYEEGPRRLFTPQGLRELVPDVRHRDVYVCGPPGMVKAAVAALRRARVRKRQIHLDPFEF